MRKGEKGRRFFKKTYSSVHCVLFFFWGGGEGGNKSKETN